MKCNNYFDSEVNFRKHTNKESRSEKWVQRDIGSKIRKDSGTLKNAFVNDLELTEGSQEYDSDLDNDSESAWNDLKCFWTGQILVTT